MGRPSKFTPKVRDKILQALRGGAHRSTAAQFGGVTHTTLRNWLLIAEDPSSPEEYLDFAEEVQKAEADAEVVRLARINKAGADGAWQADTWWLERKNPEKWGRKDKSQLEITGADGGPISLEATLGADPAAIGALAAILSNREAERQDPLAPKRDAIEATGSEQPPLDPEAFRIAPGELPEGRSQLPAPEPSKPVEAIVGNPEIAELRERQAAAAEAVRLQEEFSEIVAAQDIPEEWSAWDEDDDDDDDAWGWTS